jgi:hypothetical protein
MICPVELASEMSAFEAAKVRDHAGHGLLHGSRHGAGDESTGSDIAGDGREAAEIPGIRDRHMRRWRERYEEFGFRGLFDRRRANPRSSFPVHG